MQSGGPGSIVMGQPPSTQRLPFGTEGQQLGLSASYPQPAKPMSPIILGDRPVTLGANRPPSQTEVSDLPSTFDENDVCITIGASSHDSLLAHDDDGVHIHNVHRIDGVSIRDVVHSDHIRVVVHHNDGVSNHDAHSLGIGDEEGRVTFPSCSPLA